MTDTADEINEVIDDMLSFAVKYHKNKSRWRPLSEVPEYNKLVHIAYMVKHKTGEHMSSELMRCRGTAEDFEWCLEMTRRCHDGIGVVDEILAWKYAELPTPEELKALVGGEVVA